MSVSTMSGLSRSTAARSSSRSPQTATSSMSSIDSRRRVIPSRARKLSSPRTTLIIVEQTPSPQIGRETLRHLASGAGITGARSASGGDAHDLSSNEYRRSSERRQEFSPRQNPSYECGVFTGVIPAQVSEIPHGRPSKGSPYLTVEAVAFPMRQPLRGDQLIASRRVRPRVGVSRPVKRTDALSVGLRNAGAKAVLVGGTAPSALPFHVLESKLRVPSVLPESVSRTALVN